MDVCETFRIPHSHYLGGPLQWTPLDREKAEAYQAWKRLHCPDCGTREDEWDPKQGGHPNMYIGATRRCHGCERKEDELSNVPDDAKGVKVYLTPNPQLLAGEDVG